MSEFSEAAASRQNQILREALEHRMELVAYAWSLLQDYAAAEDVVQEAYLVVARKYEQFRSGTSMRAWCRSIVRLEVLKVHDKRVREQTLLDRLVSDAADSAFEQVHERRRKAASRDWQDALSDCLQLLNDRSREVLTQRFTRGLGYEAIAKSLGVSNEMIRKTLYRAKKSLRECISRRIASIEIGVPRGCDE